jgi:hypothetical protein
MWTKVEKHFNIIVNYKEDRNYDIKIQKCIKLLLEKVVEKKHNF